MKRIIKENYELSLFQHSTSIILFGEHYNREVNIDDIIWQYDYKIREGRHPL